MHFLFPSDPFDPREPDELFRDQVSALRERGHGVTLFPADDLQGGPLKIRGTIPAGATVAYRGWMVTPAEYQSIVELIKGRGGTPLTSLEEYVSCHYLPNWYPLLAELTAETRIVPADTDLEAELKALGWGRFFLKDYVKSLKTSVGSVVSKAEEAAAVIADMKKFRGTIEGGVCIRRFEAFVPDSEKRYFILGGGPHSSDGVVPDLVAEVARRIRSPFFAVDVAVRDDGVLRVVEVGDGQVSDLVGWGADEFADLWPAILAQPVNG